MEKYAILFMADFKSIHHYSRYFYLFCHIHCSVLVTKCFKAFDKSFVSSGVTPFHRISCFGAPARRLNTESGRAASVLPFLSQDRAAGPEGGREAAEVSHQSSREAGFSGLTLVMVKSPFDLGPTTETEQ